MSPSKIIFFLSLAILGNVIPLIVTAQATTTVHVQEVNENSSVDNKIKNIDLAPQSAKDEKPHVIGDDGQKIYFLSDPVTTINNEKPVSSDPSATPIKKPEEATPVVKPE